MRVSWPPGQCDNRSAEILVLRGPLGQLEATDKKSSGIGGDPLMLGAQGPRPSNQISQLVICSTQKISRLLRIDLLELLSIPYDMLGIQAGFHSSV